MLIYRVEHKDTGIGPYHNNAEWDYTHHNMDENNHPALYEFVSSHIIDKYYSAFLTYNDLYSWFDINDLEQLINLGYVLAIYDIPENKIIHGPYQIAFKRGKFTPVKIENLL